MNSLWVPPIRSPQSASSLWLIRALPNWGLCLFCIYADVQSVCERHQTRPGQTSVDLRDEPPQRDTQVRPQEIRSLPIRITENCGGWRSLWVSPSVHFSFYFLYLMFSVYFHNDFRSANCRRWRRQASCCCLRTFLAQTYVGDKLSPPSGHTPHHTPPHSPLRFALFALAIFIHIRLYL